MPVRPLPKNRKKRPAPKDPKNGAENGAACSINKDCKSQSCINKICTEQGLTTTCLTDHVTCHADKNAPHKKRKPHYDGVHCKGYTCTEEDCCDGVEGPEIPKFEETTHTATTTVKGTAGALHTNILLCMLSLV